MLDLSEEDAIIRLNDLNNDRKKTFKKTVKEKLRENPNFNREKSHQCIEYWLKRGSSKKEVVKKVKEVLEHLHEKTWDKRRKNPELYQDVNTTQIGYWLKKGFSETESRQKIKERQKTFTLEKCVEKHGLEKGTEIYNERHIKWSEKMENINLNIEDVYCLDNQFFYSFKKDKELKVKVYDFKIKGSKKNNRI
jgi:hypothetical protein